VRLVATYTFLALIGIGLVSCWPSRISFVDGSMPEEWKTFSVRTLDNNSANSPLSYSLELSEALRSGIQNNTRLQLNTNEDLSEVHIEGMISNYSITPVALQEGDNAAQNRLSVVVELIYTIRKPEEKEMNLTASRFVDYDASTDLAVVESTLLAEISEQIVQDAINKLLSNW
jgi:hypothetical protein